MKISMPSMGFEFTSSDHIESDITNGMVSDIETLIDEYDREPRPSKEAIFDKKIKEGVWVQRDGTETKIKDMTSSHIKNCINMLKRKEDYDPNDKGSIANKYIQRFKKNLISGSLNGKYERNDMKWTKNMW